MILDSTLKAGFEVLRLRSAQKAGVSQRALSLAAATQSIAASPPATALNDVALAEQPINAARTRMSERIVGNRPRCIEPRAIKRPPHKHALLTQPVSKRAPN